MSPTTSPTKPRLCQRSKTYFKAYVSDGPQIIDEKEFVDLATNPVFSTKDFKAVPKKYRDVIPEYIKVLPTFKHG